MWKDKNDMLIKRINIVMLFVLIYQIVILFWGLFVLDLSGQIEDALFLFAFISFSLFLLLFIFKEKYLEWIVINNRMLSSEPQDDVSIEPNVSYKITRAVIFVISSILFAASMGFGIQEIYNNITNLLKNILNIWGYSVLIALVLISLLTIIGTRKYCIEKRINIEDYNNRRQYVIGLVLVLQNILLSIFILDNLSRIGV